MPEFLLAHSTRCVNLVSEDKERYLSKLLDAEESVKLGLAFRETLDVRTVNKEDDTVNLGKVVAPEATG